MVLGQRLGHGNIQRRARDPFPRSLPVNTAGSGRSAIRSIFVSSQGFDQSTLVYDFAAGNINDKGVVGFR